MKTKAVVPQEERSLNEVDELLRRVKVKQGDCPHDFRLLEEVSLNELRGKGVLMGFRGSPDFRSDMLVRCLKCSFEKELFLVERCPRCLGEMERGRREPMMSYLGEGAPYTLYQFEAVVCTCRDCGLKVLDGEKVR